jgi:uncharacterized protein YndB with AHSA1/START domain
MQSMTCDSTAERLWSALVLPEALKLWHADEARVDLRPGGLYSYRSRLLGARDAYIDVVESGRRLRLVYETNPQWPPPGDSVIVEDFLIDTGVGQTGELQSQLRVLGSGVPPGPEWNPTLKRLKAGWAVAFSYLQRRLYRGELESVAS